MILYKAILNTSFKAELTINPLILNSVYVILGGALTLAFVWLGSKISSHSFKFCTG